MKKVLLATLLALSATPMAFAQRTDTNVPYPLVSRTLGRPAVVSTLARLQTTRTSPVNWSVKELALDKDNKRKIPLLVGDLTTGPVQTKKPGVIIKSATLTPGTSLFTVVLVNEADTQMEKSGAVYVQVVQSKNQMGISIGDEGLKMGFSQKDVAVLFADVSEFGKLNDHQTKVVVFDLNKYAPSGSVGIDILGLGKLDPFGEKTPHIRIECGLIIGEWPAGS